MGKKKFYEDEVTALYDKYINECIEKRDKLMEMTKENPDYDYLISQIDAIKEHIEKYCKKGLKRLKKNGVNHQEEMEAFDEHISQCVEEMNRLIEMAKNNPNRRLNSHIKLLNDMIKDYTRKKRKYIMTNEILFHDLVYKVGTNLVISSSLVLSATSSYALVADKIMPGYEPFFAVFAVGGAIAGGIGITGKVKEHNKSKNDDGDNELEDSSNEPEDGVDETEKSTSEEEKGKVRKRLK